MSATKILVVEDERIVGAAIKNELENFGYDCSGVASSADEAVDKTIRHKPDLVLMDIHLRGEKDGIEAAREIHGRLRTPVVFLSAFADAETVARAGETEPFGFLVKPYEEQELQTTIEMALAKHRAEERLAESDRWMSAILEGIDDAVIASDADNQTRFMNLAGEGLTGWCKEDAVGEPATAVCHLLAGGGRVALDDLVARAVSESRAVALPAGTRLASRDGRETPIEGCLSPIHDAQGEFLGTTLTFRDVGARLELERVRRQSEEQRRQAQKMEVMRSLGGGAASHLNNLLTVILGSIEPIAADPAADPKVREALHHAQAAANRAAELVERLLMFSVRHNARLHLIDLNALLPDWANEIRPQLGSQITVEVGLAYSNDGAPWQVNADEEQLKQAFLNLCRNAQEAMPRGGQLILETDNVTLTAADAANHPRGQAGEFVRLSVVDTGFGMTPEIRSQIFEPFFSTKEPGPGTGLGLALVSAVAEQHHGWVECSSEEGLGTTFALYLPRYGEDAKEHDPRQSGQPKTQGERPTILLADADPMLREFAQRILEGQGCRVLQAADGLQAVDAFRRSRDRIDLVILDLNMPRLTQNTVLERLLEFDPSVRVLLSSGYFPEDLMQDDSHIVGVLSKPYGQDELVRLVRRIVTKPQAAANAVPVEQDAGAMGMSD